MSHPQENYTSATIATIKHLHQSPCTQPPSLMKYSETFYVTCIYVIFVGHIPKYTGKPMVFYFDCPDAQRSLLQTCLDLNNTI